MIAVVSEGPQTLGLRGCVCLCLSDSLFVCSSKQAIECLHLHVRRQSPKTQLIWTLACTADVSREGLAALNSAQKLSSHDFSEISNYHPKHVGRRWKKSIDHPSEGFSGEPRFCGSIRESRFSGSPTAVQNRNGGPGGANFSETPRNRCIVLVISLGGR